jgi:hypothetical protein
MSQIRFDSFMQPAFHLTIEDLPSLEKAAFASCLELPRVEISSVFFATAECPIYSDHVQMAMAIRTLERLMYMV